MKPRERGRHLILEEARSYMWDAGQLDHRTQQPSIRKILKYMVKHDYVSGLEKIYYGMAAHEFHLDHWFGRMALHDILAGKPQGYHRVFWDRLYRYAKDKRDKFGAYIHARNWANYERKLLAAEESRRLAATQGYIKPPRASKASVNAAAEQIALNFTLRTLCNPK